MKASEIREMNVDEMEQKLSDLKEQWNHDDGFAECTQQSRAEECRKSIDID